MEASDTLNNWVLGAEVYKGSKEHEKDAAAGSNLKLMSHLCLALGETGIGKSTLMDTLFNTNFENFESSHFEPQVKLRAQTYDLQESNVRLRLTVVNTVGFGDQMNKQERWEEESVCECVIDSEEEWQAQQVESLSDDERVNHCLVILF